MSVLNKITMTITVKIEISLKDLSILGQKRTT